MRLCYPDGCERGAQRDRPHSDTPHTGVWCSTTGEGRWREDRERDGGRIERGM